jgi:DNA-binding NtrC family response regulator
VLCRSGLIEMHHLPPELRPPDFPLGQTPGGFNTLEAMEKILITEALYRHEGNRKSTARDLGIDTSTLYRKIKSLKIEAPSTDGRNKGR